MERSLGVAVLGLVAGEVPDDQGLVAAGGQEHVGAGGQRSAGCPHWQRHSRRPSRRMQRPVGAARGGTYFSIEVAKLVTQPFYSPLARPHGRCRGAGRRTWPSRVPLRMSCSAIAAGVDDGDERRQSNSRDACGGGKTRSDFGSDLLDAAVLSAECWARLEIAGFFCVGGKLGPRLPGWARLQFEVWLDPVPSLTGSQPCTSLPLQLFIGETALACTCSSDDDGCCKERCQCIGRYPLSRSPVTPSAAISMPRPCLGMLQFPLTGIMNAPVAARTARLILLHAGFPAGAATQTWRVGVGIDFERVPVSRPPGTRTTCSHPAPNASSGEGPPCARRERRR